MIAAQLGREEVVELLLKKGHIVRAEKKTNNFGCEGRGKKTNNFWLGFREIQKKTNNFWLEMP